MIRRINRLITVFFIAALCIYFVTKNSASIEVQILPGHMWSASSGVVVLSAFAFGIFLMTIAASLFAIQAYFRERKLLGLENQRKKFHEGLLRARTLFSSGELQKAQDLWEQIIKKDPSMIISRIELTKVLEARGKISDALKVIDAARSVNPENIEILFRAAELQLLQGNRTAAIDNLALILHQEPNAKAARTARGLSVDLDRYDDALEYNNRVQSIEGFSDDVIKAQGDILCKKIIRDSSHDTEILKKALIDHLKKYPNAEEALLALSDIHYQERLLDESAQYLVKAFKLSKNISLFKRARAIWIEAGSADKALSLSKSWVRDAKELDYLVAQLELAKTFLLLSRDFEASDALSELEKHPNVKNDETVQREMAILRAIIAYRSRDSLLSAAAWHQVEKIELGNARKDLLPFTNALKPSLN